MPFLSVGGDAQRRRLGGKCEAVLEVRVCSDTNKGNKEPSNYGINLNFPKDYKQSANEELKSWVEPNAHL